MEKAMTEIKVYVANLGKYNEGELVGEWFTLPTPFEEIAEAIGLNDQYEEYAIHDYEAPFSISEYSNLHKLNEIAEMTESMSDYEITAVSLLIENGCVSDWSAGVEAIENGEVIFYEDCKDMSDVAYQSYEESGQLAQLEEIMNVNYIDFEAIGRDMDIEGTFYSFENENTYIQYLR
jgi:antirestriction protein